MKSKLTATVMLFSTAIIWGFAFVAQVLGSDHVEPFTFNGIRFMLGAASLIPVYCLFEKESGLTPLERKQRHKHTALGALCGGLCLFTASALQQFGAAMTRDPGRSRNFSGSRTIEGSLLSLTMSIKGCPTNSALRQVGANTSTSKGKMTSILAQIFARTGSLHLPQTHRCGQTYQMTLMPLKYIASAYMRLKPG